MITVAIVEDNAGICEELEEVIREHDQFDLLYTCRNMKTALRRLPSLQPEVIVMDINLPDGSGQEATRSLKKKIPNTQILMFTVYEDSQSIFESLEAGASGYILKRTAIDCLVRAIEDVKNGGVPFSNEVARKVLGSFQMRKSTREKWEYLTNREEDIIQLLAKGLASKQIAAKLSVTVDTVNYHLKNIYSKLHVNSRTEAVLKYLE